jgi:hypothetical protein
MLPVCRGRHTHLHCEIAKQKERQRGLAQDQDQVFIARGSLDLMKTDACGRETYHDKNADHESSCNRDDHEQE